MTPIAFVRRNKMNTWKYINTDDKWKQEVFRTLYSAILTKLVEICDGGTTKEKIMLLVSPKVCVALQSLPEFTFERSNAIEVGYLDMNIKIRRDENASTDYVLVTVGDKVDVINVDFSELTGEIK